MRPGSFSFPNLSGLNNRLTGSYLVALALAGKGFPPGDAQHLVTGLVRCTDGTLRRYEEARLRLDRSVVQDSLMEYLHGTDDMELTFMALHRTMRVAERLCASPHTTVAKGDLPPAAGRTLLREMRNAIDHTDGQIAHAGKGHAIRLEVQGSGSTISDGARILTVSHDQLASWVQTLHSLCVALIDRPQDWIRI